MKLRFALVQNEIDIDRVEPYMPGNYQVKHFALQLPDGEIAEHLIIIGTDVAGWTMDEYVIPRLASGLIFAEEIA